MFNVAQWNKVLFLNGVFTCSSCTARRHGTPWTSSTRTKLAEANHVMFFKSVCCTIQVQVYNKYI